MVKTEQKKLYVARQPIFDEYKKVYAYELLFRSGSENFFSNVNADFASNQVIHNSLFVYGLDKILSGKKGFINVTKKILVEDVVTTLPAKEVVIELLETIEPDQEVIDACHKLKKSGYILALDDFIDRPEMAPLVDLADIIKVDFLLTKGLEREALSRRCREKKIKLLAEKVENQEEYQNAIDLGYSYFQGYFFCKPEMIATQEIPAFKLNYLRFLTAINRPLLDYDELEQIIKHEVSLSIKILRYLNSAAFSLRTKITSIKQALSLLGDTPIKKWAVLIATHSIGEDKPAEIVVTALIRARFCEQLAICCRRDEQQFDLFLIGMLSLIDVLTERPLDLILEELALSKDIKATLLGQNSPYSPIFQLVLAYERGDWEKVQQIQKTLPKLRHDNVLADIYQRTIEWAHQVYQAS